MMRRLTILVALALAAGCGGSEKKPDDSAPPPKATAPAPQPKPQPAAQPAPKPQPQPAAEPTADTGSTDDTPIVIKGSKHKDKDSGSSGAASSPSSGSDDPSRQARIDELKAKAAASQGKDNGGTYRETQPADPADPNAKKKADLRAQIDAIDQQIRTLQDDEKTTFHTEKHREGHMSREEKVWDDQDRFNADEKQIADLQGQKQLLQTKLAKLDAPPKDSAGGSGGGSTTPK